MDVSKLNIPVINECPKCGRVEHLHGADALLALDFGGILCRECAEEKAENAEGTEEDYY